MVEVAEKLQAGPAVLPLMGLAVVLIVGPTAAALVLYRFTRFFGTGEEFLRLVSIAGLVVFAGQAIAIGLLLVVLWQLEGRLSARARGEGGPAPQD